MSQITRECQTGGCAGAIPTGDAPGASLPLDLQQLVHRCLGRIELAERLLNSFETRFPADLSQVEQCLREGDSVKLARLVHQLKGAAANISAPALHGIMSRMDEAVRADRREEAGQCLAEVHEAWDQFREFKQTVHSQSKG